MQIVVSRLDGMSVHRRLSLGDTYHVHKQSMYNNTVKLDWAYSF